MIEDKHSEFAKHVNELQTVLESPYSDDIDSSLLDSDEDIEHLNKEISNINPDYLSFLPSYFWYWYFCIGWAYFSSWFFFISFISDINYFYIKDKWTIANTLIALSGFFAMLSPLLILIYQLIRKRPYRTQYYFLKQQQKVAYYYRPSLQFFKPFKLQIVDYKDLIPEIHTIKHNTAYTPLNLYIADPETGDITHHIKPHDTKVDPRLHWTFIRTYMERPSKELPIDPKLCQAYPVDTGGSLFACSDIVFRKHGMLNQQHSGSGGIVMLIISSLYVLGYLLQGNNYQCVKRAILNPKVQALLTWDGQDNPYPIQPVTLEAEQAFKGKNWQVNIRWIIAIIINFSLFTWAVIAYNS